MIREEAIKALNDLCEVRKKYVGMATMKYEIEALETAIRSLEAWDVVKAEIESNTESIIGKYDATVPEHDRPSMKIARNEARQECLTIIDKHLQSVKVKRVPFNEMFSWDEWCPEFYCSECKCQIATNEEDAKKLSSCPHCHLEFEEDKNE